MTSWSRETVASLQRFGMLLVEDGNHGEYRPRSDEFVERGISFIRAADIDEGMVLFSKASKINEEARRRITKGIGAPGDVLLSHKGTVGKLARVPHDAPSFVCSPQTTFWRSLDLNKIDGRYLYAFMRGSEFQQQLKARAGETDMAPYVSLTSQRALTVTLPPIETQRQIGAAIGSLDDKIELNRRMNETLESMARALFKDWFVDFGPVRAKMEGRQPPALSLEIAALFPDKLDEEGKPEGWSIGSLQDLLLLQRGFDLPTSERTPGSYQIVSASGLHGLHSEPRAKAPGVVTGRSGVLGKIFLLMEDYWPLNTTLWVKEFRRAGPFYSFELLKRLDFGSFNAGSAVPTLNRNHVHGLPVLVPSAHCMNAFEETASSLHQQAHKNQKQIECLVSLRDSLLPRLLSGELRVRDAGRVIAQVA